MPALILVAIIFVLGLRLTALESGPDEARASLYGTLAVIAFGAVVCGAGYLIFG